MLFWHTIWRKKQVILISAFLACPFLWHIDSNNDVLAYSLIPTHFFVALSVVCHICALRLNCSTDSDAIWQVRLCGPITHCVKWVLSPGEYKKAVSLFATLLWFLFP